VSDGVHEVYAIKYATLPRRSPDNYIGGDPHDTPQPLDFYVWAIIGESGVFVVDTGFNEATAAKRGRSLWRPVHEGLQAIGIATGDVEQVIISHFHYDHAGCTDLFPRARFHLTDAEMEYATGRCMCHQMLRGMVEVEDVVTMVRNVFAGRVVFHDRAEEIAPGINLHPIGGHTKGLQSVKVKTRRGDVVLASDAAHFYAHMEQGRVFPAVYNVGDVLEGFGTLKRLATSDNHIIPGHDPLVMERYPAAKPGLEGWIARLDLDPT
jgi:glyoxylase-like metal-dependent hydrolase (beta-lactamase superfamily II)